MTSLNKHAYANNNIMINSDPGHDKQEPNSNDGAGVDPGDTTGTYGGAKEAKKAVNVKTKTDSGSNSGLDPTLDPIAPIRKELAGSAKPKVSVTHEDHDIMRVRYTNVSLCYVNALRRTILSDIPIVVFRTFPHSMNDSDIPVNTTRRNSEILKQRLSCIPIHNMSPTMEDLKDYLLEVKETNTGQSARAVTTEHFKIKRLSTGTYLPRTEVKKMFPPFVAPNGREYYTPLVNLRPKLSDELEGDSLQFTCKMSVGTARENGSFNVSSICALQHVVDTAKQQEVLHKTMIPEWTREGKDIEFETSNWLLLDGLRHTVPNQYDLLIRSVGIHTNEELVMAAIEQTKASFKEWLDALAEGTLPIKTTESTMERGYDVQLPNENHTNGGILRTVMYNRYASGKSPTLLFVGVKKMHPFHTHSLLRVAFAADSSPQALAQIIAECIAEAIAVLSAMAVAVSGTAGKR